MGHNGKWFGLLSLVRKTANSKIRCAMSVWEMPLGKHAVPSTEEPATVGLCSSANLGIQGPVPGTEELLHKYIPDRQNVGVCPADSTSAIRDSTFSDCSGGLLGGGTRAAESTVLRLVSCTVDSLHPWPGVLNLQGTPGSLIRKRTMNPTHNRKDVEDKEARVWATFVPSLYRVYNNALPTLAIY